MPLVTVVSDALAYFQRHQLPDGSIAEEPTEHLFRCWDTVNALKAIASWRAEVPFTDDGTIGRQLGYLRSREKPSGMISMGEDYIDPDKYCTETSSEYISTLTRLGLTDQARQKAAFLRSRQLPSGGWDLVHPYIPRAFRFAPSVTSFAMMALKDAGVEPAYPDQALDSLARSQTAAGDFGVSRFYYNSPIYFIRPAVAVLAESGYHAAVAAARDFLLDTQRDDGSWTSPSDIVDNDQSAELHTGLALEGLARAGVQADETAARRAVAWLLARRRPDGSWPGGRYPYPAREGYPDVRVQQDVYATSQVLAAFRQLASGEVATA
jgi:hypothetical protein